MFYTYLHRRNDTGAVFYIGKGSGRRVRSSSSRSRHWRAIVARHGYTTEICAEWPDEAQAFAHEVFLISVFLDMGHAIINHTSGGEGASGLRHSEETRRRLSSSIKLAYAKNADLAADVGSRMRQLWAEPGNKEVISRSRKLAWSDPSTKARRVAAMHAADAEPVVRRKRSEAQRVAQNRPEAIRKQRLSRLTTKTPGGRKPTPVVCLNTGDRFESAADAARYFGLRPSVVSVVCRGERSHKNGLHFALAGPVSLVH